MMVWWYRVRRGFWSDLWRRIRRGRLYRGRRRQQQQHFSVRRGRFCFCWRRDCIRRGRFFLLERGSVSSSASVGSGSSSAGASAGAGSVATGGEGGIGGEADSIDIDKFKEESITDYTDAELEKMYDYDDLYTDENKALPAETDEIYGEVISSSAHLCANS